MSCESCKEALLIDEKEPPCFNTPSTTPTPPYQGGEFKTIPGVDTCWLPELDETGHRILEIRGKLIALKDLVDPGTVLRMYRATKEDIELLAAVEEEMRKIMPPRSPS